MCVWTKKIVLPTATKIDERPGRALKKRHLRAPCANSRVVLWLSSPRGGCSIARAALTVKTLHAKSNPSGKLSATETLLATQLRARVPRALGAKFAWKPDRIIHSYAITCKWMSEGGIFMSFDTAAVSVKTANSSRCSRLCAGGFSPMLGLSPGSGHVLVLVGCLGVTTITTKDVAPVGRPRLKTVQLPRNLVVPPAACPAHEHRQRPCFKS